MIYLEPILKYILRKILNKSKQITDYNCRSKNLEESFYYLFYLSHILLLLVL